MLLLNTDVLKKPNKKVLQSSELIRTKKKSPKIKDIHNTSLQTTQ